MKKYAVVYLKTTERYVTEIRDAENEDQIYFINPLLVEHKYNTENMPIFRYLPWQILSQQDKLLVNKSDIVFSGVPKKELHDLYLKICTGFIPLEKDEDEDE